LQQVIVLLHEALPDLTPNQVTVLGTSGLAGLALYVVKLERAGQLDKNSSLGLVSIFLAVSAADAVDGALARHLIAKGVPHDSDFGGIIDSSFDRVSEALLALLSMARAVENDDDAWFAAAMMAGLANPLSSFMRANAERQGVVVPESGKTVFEFFGTRTGRFVISVLKVLPNIKLGGVSVQAMADVLTTTATMMTAYERYVVTVNGVENGMDDEGEVGDVKMMENAERRFRYIFGVTVFTSVLVVLMGSKLRE
jgi:phosphatidylglycerophosphate synthase